MSVERYRDLLLTPSVLNVSNFVLTVSAGDSSLLFGEISGNALAGIEASLSRFLKPLLSANDGWGKADAEQKVSGNFDSWELRKAEPIVEIKAECRFVLPGNGRCFFLTSCPFTRKPTPKLS